MDLLASGQRRKGSMINKGDLLANGLIIGGSPVANELAHKWANAVNPIVSHWACSYMDSNKEVLLLTNGSWEKKRKKKERMLRREYNFALGRIQWPRE